MRPRFHRSAVVPACALWLASFAACSSKEAGDEPPQVLQSPSLWTDDTSAQLDAFWAAHRGRENFSAFYVEVVEALLSVEDAVERGDFSGARNRVDEVFASYPLSDEVWWSGIGRSGIGRDGTNVGTPVAYYGLRMLDEIAAWGLMGSTTEARRIQMTVVMPRCAEGERPTNTSLTRGESVRLELHPDVLARDHFLIRQSLRIFQQYVWAISRGALRLDPRFELVEQCVRVRYSGNPSYAGIDDANSVIEALPEEVREQTDMWWVLYPSNVPSDPMFDDVAFITGGMGGRGRAPVFIIDDLWLVRKPPHLGRGIYSDVERRVYLPQWLQHEFFHHLYRTWPEFGLEDAPHQWFNRGTWPDDFVGAWEPDYYAESLRKRLYDATPSIAHALQTTVSDFDVTVLSTEDFVGSYERRPVQNDWHRVEIRLESDGLRWRNEAGAEWALTWSGGQLLSAEDSPYGQQALAIEPRRDASGQVTADVRALYFLGEAYLRL